MKKYFLLTFLIVILMFSSCQTVQKKSDKIIKKENEKLSKFIGQPESELQIAMGIPDNEIKDDKGARILVYENKKYGIKCERKFEISDGGMVIGFTSKGCF